MILKFKIILFTIFVFNFNTYSQFNSQFYHKTNFNSKSNFDSLIKKDFPKLESSYFVITYPTLAGTTSWAPQFIKILNKLSERKENIYIVFYNNGGLRTIDIPKFMTTVLNIQQNLINKRIFYTVNDALYKTLTNNRHLVRVQFYFRGNLFYDEAEKWNSLNVLSLPTETVKISPSKKIELKNIDNHLIFEKDQVYKSNDRNLYILTDTKNQILKVDVNTGKCDVYLDLPSKYNAPEVFCKYISKLDSVACNLAIAKDSIYKKLNRKTFRVLSVHENGDTLIMPTLIEVVRKEEEEFKYTNDEGKRLVNKKGTFALKSHSVIIEYYKLTKAINIIPISDENYLKNSRYIIPEKGLIVKNDTILCSTHNWYKFDNHTYTTYGLAKLYRQNNKYVIDTNNIANEIGSDMIKAGYGTKTFFYNFANHLLYNICFSGDIYTPFRTNRQSSFYGNGEEPYNKESFSMFLEDTTSWKINFLFHEIKPIIDGKYLMAIGTYKDKPYIEIKNRMLKTIDIIDALTIPGFEKYFSSPFREDIIIVDDIIYFKVIENNKLFLYSYNINNSKYID